MKFLHHFFKLFILLSFISLLISCSHHIVTESEKLYANATLRHRQFVENSNSVSVDEWKELIAQFQRVVNIDPDGKNADNALYAIGSCWLWMYETKSTPTLTYAIESFEKLVKRYPKSNLIPDTYWWLGYCYEKIENHEQAAKYYQNIVVNYTNYKNYDKALFRLGNYYEKKDFISAAIATYKSIIENSSNKELIDQTSKKLSVLISQKEDNSDSDEFANEIQGQIDKQDTSSLVNQLGLGVNTIVIDAGHGGKDPGAVNGDGILEKDITLEVAKELKKILDKTYNVYLTRNDDTYLPLRQRTEYAIQRKADLFISLHVNSCNNPQVFGVETYYLSLASDESAERTAAMENAVAEKSINDFESLLTKILKDTKVEESCKLAELVQENIVNTINSNDRGVKRAPFIVLIGTKVPAILIEIGFLSNPDEAKLLSSKSYQKKIATSIADAIEEYRCR